MPMPSAPRHWKTNLAVLWAAQFTIMAAFFFCLPFLSLFLVEHNIVPADEAAFWGGIFFAAAPAALMITSPLWGKLGDTYGRKMMIVRSTLAGAIALYLMGSLTNIWLLILLRFIQGAFSGTLPATQTLVTTCTPKEKQGFALGLLMASVAAGNAAGAFLGGICAKHFGTAMTFRIGATILVFATLLVLFTVRENFQPPQLVKPSTKSARTRLRKQSISRFLPFIPMLLASVYIFAFQVYDLPLLPLYVDEIYRAHPVAGAQANTVITGNVLSMTGYLSALATVVSIAGSTLGGSILDRKVPRWLWPVIAVVAAIGALWAAVGQSLLSLAIGRSILLFVATGLGSVIVVLISRISPPDKRATALSWAYTARSLGWTLAPLLGALIAQKAGLVNSYIALGIATLGLAPLFAALLRRYPAAFQPGTGEPPVQAEKIVADDVATMDQS